jgi:hypothetical protein
MREQLNQVAGGERLPSLHAYARLGAHVLRCASCRREWHRLRRLCALSRQLPAPILPPSLQTSALAGRLASPTFPLRKGVLLMRVSLIAGTCLTLVLVGGLLLLPREHSALAAQDIYQALARVRSWHLKGWKLDGENRLDWEVWGQRAPFFYYERMGERETLDDGRYRYLVIPPLSPQHKHGLVLKTTSRMDATDIDLTFPALRNLTNLRNVWKREALDTTYSVQESWTISNHPVRRNDLYTFEGDSPLPRRYSQYLRQYVAHPPGEVFDERRFENGPIEKEWESTHLDAEYNVAIPSEEATITNRPNYVFLDATQDTLPPGVSPENAVVSHGITLQAKPAMVDAQGNIALVLRTWIGRERLSDRRGYDVLPLPFNIRLPNQPGDNALGTAVQSEEEQRAQIQGVLFQDDRGRAYLPLKGLGMYRTAQPTLMVLTPLEPLKPGEPLPRQISVRVYGDALQVRLAGGPDGATTEGLLFEPLALTVTLPSRPQSFDERAIARDILHVGFEFGYPPTPLAEVVMIDRADYYYDRMLERQHTPAMQPLYLQAVRWYKLAIANARPSEKARLSYNLAALENVMPRLRTQLRN